MIIEFLKRRLRRSVLLLLLVAQCCLYGQVSDNDLKIFDSLYSKGYELLNNNPDSAIFFGLAHLHYSEKVNDSSEIAYAYGLLGLSHYYKSEFDTALAYELRALEMFEQQQDSFGLSSTYVNLGNIYGDQGFYPRAIHYFMKSLDIDESYGDLEGQAINKSNISLLFYDQEDFANAEKYSRESLELTKNIENDELRSSNYNMLAELNVRKGKVKEASILAKEALALAQKSNNLLELASAYSNLGLIDTVNGNFESAVKNCQKAVALAKKYGDPFTTIIQINYLVDVYLRMKNPKMSLLYAMEAHDMAINLGKSRYLLRETFLRLSNAHLLNKDFERAFEYQRIYSGIRDEISKFNIREEILIKENELAQRQNDVLEDSIKLEKERSRNNRFLSFLFLLLLSIGIGFIALLILNIRKTKKHSKTLADKNFLILNKQKEIDEQSKELAIKNSELHHLIKTKDKLFSILTHDLKQPFTQLHNILELLKYDGLTNTERKEMLVMLKESFAKTRDTVENLLIWSKTQLDGFVTNKTEIELDKLVKNICTELSESFEKKSVSIKLSTEAAKVFADENQIKIALGNLLTNALKFSDTKSTVEVNVLSTEKESIVSVKDSGVGMTVERIAALKDFAQSISTPGTLQEKGTGLGILIVNEFMEKNGGRLKIESTLGKGSTFSLVLPKIHSKQPIGA